MAFFSSGRTPILQTDQRMEVTLLDQFQRAWHGCLEKATGEPTGSYNLVGWLDPLRTPPFFVMLKKEAVLGAAWTLFVDFGAWLDQQRNGEEQWYRDLHKAALDKYHHVAPEQVPQLENDPFIRNAVGPKPWPSSKVVQAAMNGDRQYLGLALLDKTHREALGLSSLAESLAIAQQIADAPAVVSSVPDPEAVKTIPPPPAEYPKFVAWAMTYVPECKGDLTAVARHWTEHKAAMAAV